MTCAAVFALPGAAQAATGTWGPNAVPYRNGVVCEGRSVDTALVAWTGAGGGAAFGLSPIQSGFGNTGEPATGGVGVPVQASQSGLDATTVAELAFLISQHGSDPSAGVVADVAADALNLADAQSATVTDCLTAGSAGAAQSVAQSLLTEAEHLAGPYSVNVTGPTAATPAGQSIPLIAQVTSAAGYPVPGMNVTFDPAGAGVSVSASSSPTGSDGRTTIDARVAAGARSSGAAVNASVEASVGLIETSGGDTVPLVEAGATQTFSDHYELAVDSKPDPHLTLTNAQPLLLTNGQLAQTLTVTGMNGHSGAATVSLYGPLGLSAAGCSTHTSADWAGARAAQKLAEAPQVTVTGDGSFPVADTTRLAPGCYQAVAHLQTLDASPDVSATTTGDVLTVAPVSITAAPGHGGLAPAGGLRTTLTAASRFTTSWQDVRGDVVGPRRPDASGRCPTTGWATAATAAAVASTGASTNSASTSDSASASATHIAAVDVTSGAVATAGCYAFALTGTLVLPGLGSTSVSVPPGEQSAPLHVIIPTVSVDRLSGSGVDSGGHVSATVTVSQSEGQPGSLQLELLRLPYTYRGCFGADWQRASVVDTTSPAPARTTDGDNSYQVTSAAVPGSACWTVVPVFTASANPAVRARAIAGADPMLAFTSTVPRASDVLRSATPRTGHGTARQIAVGIGVGVAVLVIVLATLLAARRGRRHETIDPRDHLLA